MMPMPWSLIIHDLYLLGSWKWNDTLQSLSGPLVVRHSAKLLFFVLARRRRSTTSISNWSPVLICPRVFQWLGPLGPLGQRAGCSGVPRPGRTCLTRRAARLRRTRKSSEVRVQRVQQGGSLSPLEPCWAVKPGGFDKFPMSWKKEIEREWKR